VSGSRWKNAEQEELCGKTDQKKIGCSREKITNPGLRQRNIY
jgi:hypothetical protein